MNRAVDGPVHDDMGGLHFAVDARVGGYDQRARLVGYRADIAADHTVHAQPAAENDVALDGRRGTDQAIDPVLRLAGGLVEHAFPLTALPSSWRAAGSSRSRRPAPGHSPLSPSGSRGRCLRPGGST